MTTRRAPLRKTTPPAPTEDQLVTRARRLPMPGPGIVITVALPFWPPYSQLYRLVPMTRREVHELEQRTGQLKPDGVVWVKRIKVAPNTEGENHGQ